MKSSIDELPQRVEMVVWLIFRRHALVLRLVGAIIGEGHELEPLLVLK